MRRFTGPLLALFLVVASVAVAAPTPKTAPAVLDDSFQHVPANAMLVVQLNGHDRIKQRMNKMIENALPKQAKQIAVKLDGLIGEAMQGRDMKAIRGDARIYLAIQNLATIIEKPELTLLLPIKDYDDFKKTFLIDEERKNMQKEKGFEAVVIEDQVLYMAPLKGYVALCSDAEMAKKITDGKAGGLNTVMSKETLAAYADADLSLFLNMKEINTAFGEQLKQFKGLAAGLFEGGGGFGLQEINKSQMELIKSLISNVFQMIEDGVGFVLAIEIRPEGANIKLLEQFGAKTPTAELLKQSKSYPLTELTTLPDTNTTYTASKLNLKGETAKLFTTSFAADDETEETRAKIKKLLKQFDDYEVTTSLAASQTGATPTAVYAVETKDGRKMLASQVEIINLLGKTSTFANVPLKGKPVVTEKAATVGALELTKFEITYDLDKAVASLPEEIRETTKATMRKTLGGDATTTWLAANDKQFFSVNVKDEATAKKLLAQFFDTKSTLGSSTAFQFTRRQLPAEASVMMMIDAAPALYSMYSSVKDVAGALPALPIPLPQLNAPNGKPAYVGIAIVLKPEHGSIDLFIPVGAVAEIHQFLGPIFNLDN